MPQELRHPQFRTGKTSNLAVKLISADNIIRSRSVIAGGEFYQKMALESCWPDRTREEERMLVEIAIEVDNIRNEYLQMFEQIEQDVKQEKVS